MSVTHEVDGAAPGTWLAEGQPSAEPLYFTAQGAALFGWYHPSMGPPARAGMVLCNAVGDEAILTNRAYRYLANRLAQAGLPTLRFDYHGTGDSSGDDRDPDRVRAWRDNIGAAIAELKRRSGVEHVGLFGVRLGGTLATLAGVEHGPLWSLVVWGPCVTGRAYLREMRALRMMGAATRAAATGEGDGEQEQEQEEAAGFVLSRSTLAAIGELDLRTVARAPAAHVLIVAREDVPGQESLLARALARHGVTATVQKLPGYAAMMKEPHNASLPTTVAEAVVSWLAELSRALPPGLTPPAVDPAPGGAASSALVTGAAAPAAVRERAVSFGPARDLFGILSTPDAPDRSGRRRAILFLNAGAVPHIGPNRMYVAMARRLAGLGVAALRFDVSGLGDSRWADNVAGRMYARDAVADVNAALAFLRQECGFDSFALVGLCSGAYVGFYTALEAADITSVVLINPQTFYFKPGDSLDIRVLGRRQLSRRANWSKLLRGQLRLRDIRLSLARQRFLLRTRFATWLAQRRDQRQESLPSAFEAVLDRGTDTLLVFSRHDPGLAYLHAHLGRHLRRLLARSNFHLTIVDGPDHTFTPVWSQEYLSGIVVGHVLKLPEPAPAT